MHEFTSQTTVLPPGCWDPTTRIEPPDTLPTKVQNILFAKYKQLLFNWDFLCESG
jgi:hypothetical protein